MRADGGACKAAVLAGLALAVTAWAQSTPSSTPPSNTPAAQPAPGTTPLGGDTPAAAVSPDKVIEPGSQMVNVKPGSIEDVNAVGIRDIGGRGWRNFYSTDTEMKMGRTYAMQIEKSTRFIRSEEHTSE